MYKPILCLDFDGVIHSYTSGWKGAAVVPDPPVPGAFNFMRHALEVFDVVIFSSRSNQQGGIDAMQAWLHANGGGDLGAVRFVTEKPPALVTLDDRALQFTGVWPGLQELRNFKPWNK